MSDRKILNFPHCVQVTGFITDPSPGDPEKWRIVFFIPMAMYILSLINFLINGKFEVQSFDPNYEDQNELIDEHEISPKKLPIDVKN